MARIAQRPAGSRSAWCRSFADARLLPAEDALALEHAQPRGEAGGGALRIAVPILPHIANFDDLDPLDAEPAVDLVRVRPGTALPGDADLVILPGSKATIADLAALRAAGFDIDIAAHLRRGGTVLGLCGGYQMLGRTIADPGRHRRTARNASTVSACSTSTTVLTGDKRLEPVARHDQPTASPFRGYEMHMGVTEGRIARGRSRGSPTARRTARSRPTAGSSAPICTACSPTIGSARRGSRGFAAGPRSIAYEALVEQTLDALAAHLAAHLDLDRLLSLGAMSDAADRAEQRDQDARRRNDRAPARGGCRRRWRRAGRHPSRRRRRRRRHRRAGRRATSPSAPAIAASG